jgi:hypothetical protein
MPDKEECTVGYRDLFNSSEWQTLMFGPLWAFSAIAGADGKIDDAETKALIKEISDAPILKAPLAREVFLAIAVDFPTLLPAYQADTRNAYAGLRDVATLLTRVDAKQAAMFKFSIMAVGKNVAEASSAAGTPGIAPEEAQAWGMISAMIGFDAKEAEKAFAEL